MRTERPVEGDDAPAGEFFPQVIEGAAVAEADLEDRALLRQRQGLRDMVEHVALGGHAADEAFKTAHAGPLALRISAAPAGKARRLA